MLSRLAAVGNFLIRITTGSNNPINAEDTNRAVTIDTAISSISSTNVYRGSDVIPKSLTPRITAQNEANSDRLEDSRAALTVNTVTSFVTPSSKIEDQDWGLPPGVKKTLDELFRGSSYHSVDVLPVYLVSPDDNSVEREKMEASIMKGTINGHKFIVIKVDSKPSVEYIQEYFPTVTREILARNREMKGTLFLYQYRENRAFIWGGGKGSGPHRPMFFTENFINSEDGSLSCDQEKNFHRVKKLIKHGVAKDLRGLIWKIPEN